MRSVLAIALGGTVTLAASHSNSQRRDVAAFPAGTTWDIILDKSNGDVGLDDLSSTEAADVSAMDVDLFDNEASTIAALKEQGKQVICYFSAGSREDWRDDADSFRAGDYGQGLEGWDGENWVNVKSENVRSIMRTRIQLAAEKGCTAVDPDNVDGYNGNQDGFGYTEDAYVDYIKFLAAEAASANLAIGLKNAIEILPDVVDVVQFAVNEQCHEYDECAAYEPLTAAGKAVFNIEYGGDNCASPAGVNLSVLIKPEDQRLDTLGGACGTSEGSKAKVEVPTGVTARPAIGKTTPGGVQTAVGPAVRPTAKPQSTPEADDAEEEDEDEDEDEDENEDEE